MASLKELTEETIPQWAAPMVTPLRLIGSTNKRKTTAKFDLVFTHLILVNILLSILKILKGAVFIFFPFSAKILLEASGVYHITLLNSSVL